MEYRQAMETIRRRLSQSAPRRFKIDALIPAAVILPFFDKQGQAYLLFTRRTDTVEHHKGQVSFPGGARESQDNSLLHTALRETEEEVGIPADSVEVIGRLDDYPTISKFIVSPFVGTIPYPYPKAVNHDEVAELLEVPLSLFLDDRHFEVKQREYAGRTFPLYYYYYGDAVIWGVTGYIIHRFISQVFDYDPAPNGQPPDPLESDLLRRLQDRARGNR